MLTSFNLESIRAEISNKFVRPTGVCNFLSVPQVSEAAPSDLLHRCRGDGGSLLPLHATAQFLPAPCAVRRALRLL